MDKSIIDETKLPFVVRMGKLGIVLSLLGLSLGGSTATILDGIFGIKHNGIPVWLWPILIIIWTPGIIGFLLSFYTIARYPYLSLATGGGEPFRLPKRRLWSGLGILFYFLAIALILVAIFHDNKESISLRISQLYLGLNFIFFGFYIRSYDPQIHPTIGTFLELTFGIGLILFPVYLPVLCFGSWRCKKFLKSIDDRLIGSGT